jgi:lipopolysaccharide/colanic/teichoic acid biosynthesis glycosyltransferase
MSQSKPLPPTSSSTRLNHLWFAPFSAGLSLLCVFLLGKMITWQVVSVATSRFSLLGLLSGISLHFVLEFFLVGILALSLQQSFRTAHLSTKNSLRAGFFGAWLAAFLAAISLWQVSPSLALGTMLLGFLAAFGGSLVATARITPLWEENLPPSAEARQRVLEQHHCLLGMECATPVWKRVLDIGLCLMSFPLTIPLTLLIAAGIWLEDPGAIFFVKNSVGKWGKNFRQLKFRTMIQGAEEGKGPTLAHENDPRALCFGRLLRKTALDELPQLWNILRGEMSFVGPRPQRTALVDTYLHNLPQYAERHRLPPGLSGLAQVAGSYYLTPLQKLRFDRLYIRHASLGYDLRLLAAAFALTFYYRWKPGWNGHLPRRWLHAARRLAGAARLSKAPH